MITSKILEEEKKEVKTKSPEIVQLLINYSPNAHQIAEIPDAEPGPGEEELKKLRLDWLLTDPRAPNFYSCVQCGACTGICPAASLDKKYNPRRLVECLLRGWTTEGYPLEKCFSCYTCKYACRKGNCVADIIKILKENEWTGLNSNHERCQEELYCKSLYEQGLCVTFDALSPDKIPEWGSSWERIYSNMKKFRSELGLEVHCRKLPQKSLDEIREIVASTKTKKFKKEGEVREVTKRIPGDKIYLFHSCFADAHYPGITESVKFLFDRLGIDYIDDPRHSSCTGFGYYVNEIPFSTTLAINARNFALAEETGYLTIAPICQTSYGVLTESAGILNSGIGRQVNEKVLSNVNRKYKGEVNIVHISEILWAHRDRIKENVKHRLKGLRVATHNGCHYAKMFRKSAVLNLLDELVSITGAEPLDYVEKSLCCGMGFDHTVEPERRYLTRIIARRKLLSAKEAGADLILVACPGCQITLDRNQELIEKESDVELGLPVINYAQFLALALGADPYRVVGIQTHSNALEGILAKFDML
jgi:heterodisulfide reductase subunit B/heterodisulfide reductase subunit C